MRKSRLRLIRLLAVQESRGLPVPVFVSDALNRAVVRAASAMRAARRAWRYRRSDNGRAIRENT